MDYEKRIWDLISQMTLEEKIGQLQQCGPSLVGAFDVSFEELLDMMFDGKISQEEFARLMETAEQDYHEEDLRAGRIGSYNGIGDAATANRLQKIAVEESRLGIPLLFGYDVIHGFRTVTPIPLAESCAWEPSLWEETARMAAKEATAAGMEMDMTSNVYSEELKALIEKEEVSERVLDSAVADVLRIKFELGLFEHPYQTDEIREKSAMLTAEHRALARKVAVNSIVLLKNEKFDGKNPILPLKEGTRLGIVGKLADSRAEMTGAWAIGAEPEACVSMVDACQNKNISYQYTETIAQAEQLADEIDVFVAAVGESKEQSGEAASRADITLSQEDAELVERLLATGKPVIVVLFNGRPLAIPQLAEHVPAILEAWHPGVEAGNAILDILFGKENPSAKLTTTFPAASGQCPMYYAHFNTGRPGGKSKFTSKYLDAPIKPVFPFGYGLSYTSFEYQNLNVEWKKNTFYVTVEVCNCGKRDGKEIVQCYIKNPTGSRVRPVRQLKGFQKLEIPAGEMRSVSFEIPLDDVGYYDWNMKKVVDFGEYTFYVGGNVEDTLEKSIDIARK